MVRTNVSRGTGVIIVGSALIAVTYGLIRFSYGQFMPTIRAELGLSEGMAGLISSALFFGNCVALLFAAVATERLGGRIVATVAGLVATVGLLGMSVAPSPLAFAGWLMLAGSSAGLSMPPLVSAIMRTVMEERRPLATTIVNAGTSLGILLSGPIAIYFTGAWRLSFLGFAALAMITTVATFLILPKGRYKPSEALLEKSAPLWRRVEAFPLLASAFLFGAVSATFWTFGGEILSRSGGWSATDINWYWIIIGVSGLLGAPTGLCVDHFGVRRIHTFSYLMMAAATILLGLASDNMIFPIIAGVMFGVLYILQSGLYLVWGLRVMPDRPAVIVAAAFFMLPLGQVAGSLLMGYGIEAIGTNEMLFFFVLACLLGAVSVPARMGSAQALMLRGQP